MSNKFPLFAAQVTKNFVAMNSNELFTIGVEKDLIWDHYLKSFPEGTNPVFRVNTEHDGSYDRNFIKNIGRLVTITDSNTLVSVWENCQDMPYPYNVVAEQMDKFVKSFAIADLFRTKEQRYGSLPTKEFLQDGVGAITWTHFYGAVPARFVSKTPASIMGNYKTAVHVFQRGLVELASEALQTVLDLISNNNLYRGDEFEAAIFSFASMQRTYSAPQTDEERNIFVWKYACDPASRFRNTAIGTLIQDLSEGVELEAAVRMYEAKVAPANYKRPTALITPSMITAGLKKLDELGLSNAVYRRAANIKDLTINNVLWASSPAEKAMRSDLEQSLLSSSQVKAPKPVKATGDNIGIDVFMRDVVPTAMTMELLFKNSLKPNLVSLTAPAEPSEAPTGLFAWNNDFAWSYIGNLTDSIKEKVKRAGGNTEAKLRVSLAWSNADDLDIHCDCPDGQIYFGNKMGILDVDMNAGGVQNATDPVENLSWSKPRDGQYTVNINQYNQRSMDNVGFQVELEFDGQVHLFSHPRAAVGNKRVLTFKIVKGEITDIKSELESSSTSKEVWSIKTETLVPVSALMYSPNHWDENQVGNKHWFFMLEGCFNNEPIRGIYNEYLNNKLNEHRKVFEVLGSKTMCPVVPDQLNGVGFSSTKEGVVTIKVASYSGEVKTYNVQF